MPTAEDQSLAKEAAWPGGLDWSLSIIYVQALALHQNLGSVTKEGNMFCHICIKNDNHKAMKLESRGSQ